MTTKGIIKIVEKGASVIVDCRRFSFIALQTMLSKALVSGANITLRHFCYSDWALDQLTGICPKQISLDLTDIELREVDE